VEGGDPRSYFLDTFGRPRRRSSSTCERRLEPTLSQTLHLINGRTVAELVDASRGRLAHLLESDLGDREMIAEIWLAAYARYPRSHELERIAETMDETVKEGRAAAFEDLLWAVFNSREFVFNH